MQQSVVSWLQRLVQIPSVTPNHAGPKALTPGEGAMITYLARAFQDLQADEIIYDPVWPQRDNLYGIWYGTNPKQIMVLDVHVDTVGVEQMTIDPFAAEVRDGRVYGRGAVDTKASLAIALALIEAQQASGQAFGPTIVLAATVDEEEEGGGALALAKWLRQRGWRPQQMIVAEPTMCTPVYGHKGLVRMFVTVHGQAAHTAQPHLGQNAITAMADVIKALAGEHERLQTMAPARLGHGTLTVSLIEGGRGLNIVPDQCRIGIDRRVVDGEDCAVITRQLQELCRTASGLPVTFEPVIDAQAFFQDPDHAMVQAIEQFHAVEATIAPYGTNAYAYDQLAECCVVYGPGSIDQAHTADEWIAIEQLDQALAWYQRWWLGAQ